MHVAVEGRFLASPAADRRAVPNVLEGTVGLAAVSSRVPLDRSLKELRGVWSFLSTFSAWLNTLSRLAIPIKFNGRTGLNNVFRL